MTEATAAVRQSRVSGFVQSRLWVHNLVSLISVDRWLRGLGIGSAVS